ncbi:DHA2 family efflux MFS transporter permease subunit [Sutcliffiella rhizosphaerae]|uniref:Fatty acid resistance protein FarB n=1 Tax=Sutcliffiella rhizosphaerae TaxID=2880967 RepID=A0ABM8YUK1_9BACI|nr:DHA2 family efflux MFS transporter permease subunit [Sutcliffiella rhizosphaerae]CAG9623655.1 Fatty acid resistance protein FarB [Sutcliffiella rhizosphaerae]
MAFDASVTPTKQITDMKKGPLIAVMIIGAFVAVLNETLMNVALSEIMVQLNITASIAQWLTTSYMLTIGILIPITAYLMQRFTTRQLYLTAMGLFTLGTFIAGVSPNFELLLAGRVIQAAGTGIILPLMSAVVLALISPEKRGRVMGALGVVILFAPAIGPTVSGVIIVYFSWRMLFFFVLPIAIFALLFSWKMLRNVIDVTKLKLDFISVLFSTLGFGGIVYGFSSAGKGGAGWASLEVLIGILVGCVGLIFFTIRQNRLEHPMLSLRPFSFPLFTIGAIILTLTMMAMFSSMILLPMFLQDGLNISALQTGLAMLPGGIIMGIMSPLSGKLFDKYGARWLSRIGLVIVAVTLLLFSFLDINVTLGKIILLHSFMMLGISLFMMPIMTMSLNQLPKEFYSHGSAILNTVQQVSGAIGTALLITIMSRGQEAYMEKFGGSYELSLTSGVNQAFLFACGTIVFTFLISLLIKDTSKVKQP